MMPMVKTATMILASELARPVLELIPDKFAKPGVLRQHLSRDQDHPANTPSDRRRPVKISGSAEGRTSLVILV